MENNAKIKKAPAINYGKLIPVLLCFFVMGFVDLTGAATSFIKDDFELSDTVANLIPSMVFFWFLVFSVPSSLLMNRIGRKNTVLVSLCVTLLALILPLLGNSFPLMLAAFALLGIGNTIMQTSINPLVSSIIRGDKMASIFTFGQFIKAIASFLAPIIMAAVVPSVLGWKMLFPIFGAINLLSIVWLWVTKIEEEPLEGKPADFAGCFKLLGKLPILLMFFGIMCHVGIDVGTNVTAPKLLIERLGFATADAAIASSVYFLFRTLGCLSGSFILAKFSTRNFYIASVLMIALGMAGLFFASELYLIYICVGLIGFGNSNTFSIFLAQALDAMPERTNEVSGLMIMGLIGGAIFPFCMGLASDALGSQIGSVAVMSIGVVYMLLLMLKIKK